MLCAPTVVCCADPPEPPALHEQHVLVTDMHQSPRPQLRPDLHSAPMEVIFHFMPHLLFSCNAVATAFVVQHGWTVPLKGDLPLCLNVVCESSVLCIAISAASLYCAGTLCLFINIGSFLSRELCIFLSTTSSYKIKFQHNNCLITFCINVHDLTFKPILPKLFFPKIILDLCILHMFLLIKE